MLRAVIWWGREMDGDIGKRAHAVRAFSRVYTKRIGLLDERYLRSGYSLTQVRVLVELADRGEAIVAVLARDLGLDSGYLSRIVQRLRRAGLVERQVAAYDRRQGILRLTELGGALAAEFDQRSQAEVGAMLEALPEASQRELVASLDTARRVLAGESAPAAPLVLRSHRPGDMGWVVEEHGRLYAEEFKWDDRFEALIAEIVAGFLRSFDPARERCWIAEQGGKRVGSVFVVRQDDEVAKLRLLLVDPAARGIGLGQTLVHECVLFARAAGYRTLRLWTNDVLVAARRIYEREGFRLVATEPHTDFGIPMVGETWEIAL